MAQKKTSSPSLYRVKVVQSQGRDPHIFDHVFQYSLERSGEIGWLRILETDHTLHVYNFASILSYTVWEKK